MENNNNWVNENNNNWIKKCTDGKYINTFSSCVDCEDSKSYKDLIWFFEFIDKED